MPKYRFRILTGAIRELVEQDIRMICEWKGVMIDEINIRSDHIHMVVSIPPKISISEFMGVLKGKIAIKLFKGYPNMRKKPYWGNHFWAAGYFVATVGVVGVDEELIKRYVKYQEKYRKET